LGDVVTDKILAVAIHHLHRDGNGAYKVVAGNSAIPVTQTAQRLIDELHKLYARRASKSYGKFSANVVDYPTSTNLKSYLSKTTDFDQLTLALMATLAKEAGARAASTGGHVFFAHFDRDSVQYLLVAIVTDKLSAALTVKQDLEDVKHLDVDGFRFAGRVSLTGWAANEERYIGFLKGKGTVSEYFKDFLGCDTTIQSRVETTSLVNALKSFADTQKFTPAQREAFMDRALDICDRDARAEKAVDFATLANELHPEEPEALVEVLADPKLSLNDGFVADRRALKGLVNFKKRTPNWSVEFERRALHAGKVRYNADEKSITLLDVPADMQRELAEEITGG